MRRGSGMGLRDGEDVAEWFVGRFDCWSDRMDCRMLLLPHSSPILNVTPSAPSAILLTHTV